MSNSLGSLIVTLGMDAGEFIAGMNKAEAENKKRVDNITRQFENMGKYIAGLGLGAALTSAIKGTSEYANEVDKLARLSNTSTEEIQRQAYAANTVGISMEKLGDIYKDVQDKVGDFMAGGGGEMKDFFENIAPKVGVTADQFARLSGPEALQLYVSSLQKAGVSQNEMVFYLEALANDATLLLPLLQNNGKAMRDLGDEAQRLGSVLDSEAIRAGKEFDRNVQTLQANIQVMSRTIGNSVIPTINNMAGAFDGANSGGLAFARFLGETLKTTLEATAVLGNNVSYTLSTLGDTAGAYAAVSARLLQGDLDGAKAIGAAYKEISEQRRAALDASDRAILMPIRADPSVNERSLSYLKRQGVVLDPSAGVGTGKATSTKDPFAESKKFLEDLQKRRDTVGELTEYEKALAEVQSGRLGKLATSTRESILTTAKEIDQRKQQAEDTKARIEKGRAEALAAGDAVLERNKQYQESIAALIAASPTGKLEEQRKVMQDLADEYERGRFGIAGTTEAIQLYSETVNTYLGNVVKQTDEAAEMAKRLGDSYASAFSSAFTSGSSLSDLLKRLAFETVNIKFLTPAAQKAGDWLSAGVSSLFKSYDGGGYTGSGSRSGGMDGKGGYLAMLHPQETVLDHTKGQGMTMAGGGTSVTQHITIDARGADAGVENRIRAAMDQVRKEIVPTVVRAANSGGSTARALGRA